MKTPEKIKVHGAVSVHEIEKNPSGKYIMKKEVFNDNMNLNEPIGIASLTKLMTALTVYEIAKEKSINTQTQTITITPANAAKQARYVARIGSTWTIDDAVSLMVMKSDNTIANALASHLVPKKEFMSRMNVLAKKLGMNSTIYHTPS